jgi:uncharacterized protein involved in response to NO
VRRSGSAFRPFFLLTAAHGALAMAAWIAFLSGLLPLPDVAGGAVVWHAHEMLFGFAMASIVGFLLTAVPEFTGLPSIPRRRLHVLVALWLGGRLAFTFSGALTAWPAALCDLALLLTLIASVAGPLWRQPDRRHVAFIYNLLALLAVHAGFYAALLGGHDPMPWLRLSIGVLMALIIVALSRISMRLVNDVLEAQGGESAPIWRGRRAATWPSSPSPPTAPGIPAARPCRRRLAGPGGCRCHRQPAQRLARRPRPAPALGTDPLPRLRVHGARLRADRPRPPERQRDDQRRRTPARRRFARPRRADRDGRSRPHAQRLGLDHRRWLPLGALLFVLAALARAGSSTPFGAAAATAGLHAAATLWIAGWSIYLAYSLKPLSGPRPDDRGGCDEATGGRSRYTLSSRHK